MRSSVRDSRLRDRQAASGQHRRVDIRRTRISALGVVVLVRAWALRLGGGCMRRCVASATARYLAAAAALLATAWWPAVALARPVRIRGGARLLAHARFVDGATGRVLELRGQLSDDGGVPIVGAWVLLRRSSALKLGAVKGCPRVGGQIKTDKDPLSFRTDARGQLCVRWPSPAASGHFELHFPGDEFHAASGLSISFDRDRPQRLRTRLRFDPRPTILDLDKDRLLLSGDLTLQADGAYAPLQGLSVAMFQEKGEALARASVSGNGKFHMTVLTKQLAPPGPGTLTLKFAGSEQLEPAVVERRVTRRAEVTLRLLEPLERVHAGDELPLILRVKTLRGHVEGGVVEVVVGGNSLASAAVVEGRAEVTLLVDTDASDHITATARYLPASPWLRSGPSLVLEVPVAPPNPVWRALLFAIVVLSAGWVVFSWRRTNTRPKRGRGRPLLTPGVHVIASRDGGSDYRGQVLDAHDGHPIAHVTIAVRAPSLAGSDVLLETTSDDRGAFAFELKQRPDAAEIVAEGPLHAQQRRALPAAGQLRIALMTRRRALLQRLVQWARVRGAPYDDQPDPTPAHVRRQARGRTAVEGWAHQIERAAYGPAAVDAAVEEKIRAAEPGPEQR